MSIVCCTPLDSTVDDKQEVVAQSRRRAPNDLFSVVYSLNEIVHCLRAAYMD